MKRLMAVFIAMFTALLTGCGLSTLPESDAMYFRQQTEVALARPDGVKELLRLDQNDKAIVIIALRTNAANAETDCLKVVETLARNSGVPAIYDEVNIKAECSEGTHVVQEPLPVTTVVTSQGYMITGPQLYNSRTVELFRTTYSCTITRAALLRGEKPRVIIRGGVYVSGPNLGEKVNAE